MSLRILPIFRMKLPVVGDEKVLNVAKQLTCSPIVYVAISVLEKVKDSWKLSGCSNGKVKENNH